MPKLNENGNNTAYRKQIFGRPRVSSLQDTPHRFHCGSDPFWAGQVPKPYGELGQVPGPEDVAYRWECSPVHVLDRREIVAGIVVAIKPRWGAYIVALWLLGIILNLVTYPGFYDVALRDFGLLLAGIGFGTLVTSL
jgi:hypothetical protein